MGLLNNSVTENENVYLVGFMGSGKTHWGKAWAAASQRSFIDLDEVIEKHRGGRIAVFTHTGAICILILHLMGALDAPELKPVWIATSNCGLARFDLRDDGFVRVIAVNDTSHLIGI